MTDYQSCLERTELADRAASRGRRDRNSAGRPRTAAVIPRVEVRRAGRGGPSGDVRPVVGHAGRAAQAPGPHRGLPLLPAATRDSIPLPGDDLSDLVVELKVPELLMDPAADVDDTAADASGDTSARWVPLVEHPRRVAVVLRPGDGVEIPKEMVESFCVALDGTGGEHGVHLSAVVALQNDHAILMELRLGERRQSLVTGAERVGDQSAKPALIRLQAVDHQYMLPEPSGHRPPVPECRTQCTPSGRSGPLAAQAMPSTTYMRARATPSRILRISVYSSLRYQSTAACIVGNSSTTVRPAGASPSSTSTSPPRTRYLPPAATMLAAALVLYSL